MTVKTAAITVGTSATLLTTNADSTKAFEGGYQCTAELDNTDASVTVYVGGPDVTTSTGTRLLAQAQKAYDLGPDDALYGIVASGSVSVRVLETGV